MLLLGFGNKARQGKDTAAEAIKNYFDKQNAARLAHVPTWKGSVRVGIFKYATALYAEVNEAIAGGIWETRVVGTSQEDAQFLPAWVQPEPNAQVSTLAPYGKHPKLLQWWGTEYRRAQDADYWVKKTFAGIPDNLDIAMITDVRFPNEVDGVRQRGGYTINMQRLQEDGTPFYSSDRPADHPSETAVDDSKYWDFFIKTKNGHVALVGEQAITLTEYLRGLK